MGKNYVESSLKRFLKRKVKITMGFVVAFMIMGTVGFAEVQPENITGEVPFILNSGEKYIKQNSLNMTFNKNEHRRGILIEPNTNTETSMAKSKIETLNDLNIFVKHYDAVGICTRNGGELDINSKSLDINVVTEEVDPAETRPAYQYSIAMGIDLDNHPNSKGLEKGGKVNITADTVNITAEAKQDAGWAYGINCITRTTNLGENEISRIIINAKDTNITAITKTKGASNGIIAWSQGQVLINNGNVAIKADNIINTRGNSLVELNKNNNSQNTVKLDGDIVFEYNAKQSGTTIDSDVVINLANENSKFNGKIYTDGGATPTKSIINGMKLGFSNGGTWNVTGNSFANEIVIKDGGKISFGDTVKTLEIWNREKATDKLAVYDKGIQMQGGAIIEGNGNIKAYKLTLENIGNIEIDSDGNLIANNEKLNKIVYGNAITVTNNGNILALGKDSSITGNIFVDSNAELVNNGTLKVIGTLENNGVINLSKGTTITLDGNSSFENKNSATLNVESEATAVTGGKTINSGIISLKDTDNSDKTVSKLLSGGELTNKGTIALSDRTEKMTEKEWDTLLGTLVTEKGVFTNTGMVVDKAGNSIFSAGTVIEGNTTTGELVDSGVADSGSIKIKADKDLIISGTKTEAGTGEEAVLKDLSVNVEGNLTLAGNTTADATTGVLIENVAMNVSSGKSVTVTGTDNKLSGEIILNGESKLAVSDNADVTLSGKVSQGETIENKVPTLELANGTLNLVDASINVGIEGTGKVTSSGETSLKDIAASEFAVVGEKETNTTIVDGSIKVNNIVVGKDLPSAFVLFADNDTPDLPVAVDELKLTSNSKFEEAGTLTIKETGLVSLAVDADGNNAFKNTKLNGTDKVTVKGDNNEKTTDLMLETEKLSGATAKIEFGDSVIVGTEDGKVTVDVNSEIYDVKNNELSGVNSVELVYNSKLYEDNSILNNINNSAAVINDFFSQDTVERKVQLDKFYSSNIYSETVKAAYDNVKMNEEAVESLARKSETGKWTAEGKALYSKNEYNRKGIVGDYSSEIESTGLMATFGYGVNETTTAGIAFSGVKQDVDTDDGSADADLFYLGLYGNKVVGNYDFTAGLGYQFGEYDADNNILAGTGDKYDSQTVSGYVQGRYTADLGDGLSVQPKVKLGYTYVKQNDAKDSYFGVEDAEISTFDAEAGFDVVKSVQLEKSKVDVKFGASYIRTMGDTDEEFTGRFYGVKASEGFNVLGAELAENVVKFNLGAEVTNENGFFYNGGFTYEFGSNDTEAYGVNVGVGYKF